MYQIINNTPFQAALTCMTGVQGEEEAVVAVKATFELPLSGEQIRLSENQVPILYQDEYWGQPQMSSLKYPMDVVLGKAGTDIGLIGHAYSRREIPVQELVVSMRVAALFKEIRVFGDRHWRKRSMFPDYEMTAASPFIKMPLVFERAFGGTDLTHANVKKRGGELRNPVGTGYRINDHAVAEHNLPNLEDPRQLISGWRDKPTPANLGFIASSWQPRLQYAGTYDDAWRKERMPILPEDFNIRFFNYAMPDLCAIPFLQGGEQVYLTNLSQHGDLSFRLPQYKISLIFQVGESKHTRKALLYTVLFEPDDDRLQLVWGCALNCNQSAEKLRYLKIEFESDPWTY